MCTVSWLHQPGGYDLFCNRDEKRTRGTALPPAPKERDGVLYLAPIDADWGGTWLAVNEFGLSLCLLNESRGVEPSGPRRSRGLLIPQLASVRSAAACLLRMTHLDLAGFAPFALVILEPEKPAAVAYWQGRELAVDPAGDVHMPLTSSAYDAAGVRRSRLREFSSHLGRARHLDAALLNDFHASHGAAPNAYSTCMHRQDAQTVSFSWVRVTRHAIQFRYSPSAPCQCSPGEQQTLLRAASQRIP
jgi:hypothetical protein